MLHNKYFPLLVYVLYHLFLPTAHVTMESSSDAAVGDEDVSYEVYKVDVISRFIVNMV